VILALDPLLSGDVGWWPEVTIVVIKVVLAFVALLVAVMAMVWFERKFIGDMQNRIGPNKAGPFGLLQTLADGLKLAFKEDLLPDRADRFVFRLAPLLAVVPAFGTFAIIPIAGNFNGKGDGTVSLILDLSAVVSESLVADQGFYSTPSAGVRAEFFR